MGFDLDQLFTFGGHYLLYPLVLLWYSTGLHRAPQGSFGASLYREWAKTQIGDTMFVVFFVMGLDR